MSASHHIQESEVEYILASWRFVNEARKARKPERLASFVQRSGGVEDPDGDVLGIVGSHRVRPGLLRKTVQESGLFCAGLSSGHTLDDWALRAWEQGFIVSETRPTVAAFLEALAEDIHGNPVVRQNDLDALEVFQAAQQLEEDLGRLGLDTARTEAEARTAIDAYNRAVGSCGGGEAEDWPCEGDAGLECDPPVAREDCSVIPF